MGERDGSGGLEDTGRLARKRLLRLYQWPARQSVPGRQAYCETGAGLGEAMDDAGEALTRLLAKLEDGVETD
jgi:hypothetical protein